MAWTGAWTPAPGMALAAALQGSAGGGSSALLWLVVLCAVLLAACGAALWLLVGSVRQLADRSAGLRVLDEIRTQLSRLAGERSDIDLRRIEHVLLDVRDGLSKVEGALLDVLQSRQPGEEPVAGAPPHTLAERIVNRLLALGYVQVELAAEAGEIEAAAQDGNADVLVEARRNGVLHKGRVRVEGGRIRSVDMNPAYSVFP